jgi:hypothetical protein
MPERAEMGWQGLADMIRCSVTTIIGRKEELEAHGVIFYRWIGKPRRKRVLWFPSVVQRYCAHKGRMKEFV